MATLRIAYPIGICAHKLALLIVISATTLLAQTHGFRWANSADGSGGDDLGAAIDVDRWGNSYVTGNYNSPSLSFGSITLFNAGNDDMFLVKYDPKGNVIWARNAGGTGVEYGTGIAVDGSGNCYVVGYFNSATLTLGYQTLINSGGNDLFLVKYDAGGGVVWARNAGGVASELGYDVAVDTSGNCYVAGSFATNAVTFGGTTLINTNPGSYDMFDVKYDSAGTVVWAKSAGGPGSEIGYSIAVDLSGNSFVAGYYNSTNVNFGPSIVTNGGDWDMFIVKYNASGSAVWAQGAGGTFEDDAYSVGTDRAGNCYVTGYFTSPAITFGPVTLSNVNPSFSDIFLVKYSGSGNVVWAQRAGGNNYDVGNGVAVSAAGESYLTGYFTSPTIDFGPNTLATAGGNDLFVVKYDSSGMIRWATRAGGVSSDNAKAIALDEIGNSYICGSFHSPTLNAGSLSLVNMGGADLFTMKLDGDPPVLTDIADIPDDQGGEVMLHWNAAAIDRNVSAIRAYSIWRAVPVNLLPSAGHLSEYALETAVHRSRRSLFNGAEYYWEWLADLPAHLLPAYGFAAPTLSDSLSAAAPGTEYFFVSAETGDPDVYYDSNIDSGYSVDNLSPLQPTGLSATALPGTGVDLRWDPSPDTDIQSYEVHRSPSSGFIPGPGSLLGVAVARNFTDGDPLPGMPGHYRVVAIDVHGNRSKPSDEAVATQAVSIQLDIRGQWNMVSVPLTMAEYEKTALFPDASSAAYAFSDGYYSQSVLENGKGYWIKFPAAQTVTMTGGARLADTVEVFAGWNMIGGLSSPIEVDSVGSIPGGMEASPFYGYNGGYEKSSILEPGKGYWVKVDLQGKLVLGRASELTTSQRIRFQDDGEPPPPGPGEASFQTTHRYSLLQNYPNPFNPVTSIPFEIAERGRITLKVYDLLGREVATLIDEEREAGTASVEFDASALVSGVYVYRITVGRFMEARKLLVVR
jgi:hypothetical protein